MLPFLAFLFINRGVVASTTPIYTVLRFKFVTFSTENPNLKIIHLTLVLFVNIAVLFRLNVKYEEIIIFVTL